MLIAETTNALTDGRLYDIRSVLNNLGFELVKEENANVFTFIEAKKL